MGKRILFSPIGGTDPIKYLRDGSMLHICRHYKPDAVYLYLSYEMLQNHKKDNRYVLTLNKLGELIKHHFEIHIIEREYLTDVQQYDVFFKDFRTIIREIESRMEADDGLLINMASGTPAMKSALLVMATLAEYRFLPIQVSTPQKRINSEYEDRENYDVGLNWELNEDNEEDADNRCTEVHCLNLMKLLKIEAIKKHLGAFDYAAALSVADEIKGDIPPEAYILLQAADARVKLDGSRVSKLLKAYKYNIYPVRDGDKQKIFEYALLLQMKVQKEEYADFIRGITPIVVDLLENVLKSECNIDIQNLCDKKNNILYWNRTKLVKAGLWADLDAEYQDKGGFKGGNVYSHHITKLISLKSNDAELIRKVQEISDIEGKVRNVATHDIISVTDEWFQKRAGKNAKEIFGIIKYLIVKSGIRAKEEYWDSYHRMNKMIMDELY